jgi:tetratricopeptide (TPR) repeat protein
MDQAKACEAAAQAFELNEQGRLEESEERYRAALADADPRHHSTPAIHGEYASLLTKLHRNEEAGRQYERWLQLELQQYRDEASAPVLVARYFLGEHYLRMGDADSARRVVAPSLDASPKPFAWLVEAEALWLSGGMEDARAAAERALSLALDDAQRERMRERLSELWRDASPPTRSGTS